MDVLKNKVIKDYLYTSRYNPFPMYYNLLDNKYVYGVTSYLNDDTAYTIHTVKQEDSLDSLALYYYGRPDLFWAIADYNRITDCYTVLYGNYETIKIPSINDIKFKG